MYRKVIIKNDEYLGFFTDGDVDFPAAAAHTFGAALEAFLLQGDVLAEPGI